MVTVAHFHQLNIVIASHQLAGEGSIDAQRD